MKVKELKRELEKYPPDMEVLIQQGFPDPIVNYAVPHTVRTDEVTQKDSGEVSEALVIDFE
jgi:hypothetical protein